MNNPEGWISTSAAMSPDMVDNFHRHHAFERLNKTLIPTLMTNLGLYNKANVRGIVRRNIDGDEWTVVLKVITSTGNVLLEDDWRSFPSEELKAKLLMVVG